MNEKIKPTNWFYVVAYWLIKIYLAIVHPVKAEGAERLPRHNVLLCPNHSSD